MYCINASIVEIVENGTMNRQVPTFYLHENVQGILNEEQAEKIAKSIFLFVFALIVKYPRPKGLHCPKRQCSIYDVEASAALPGEIHVTATKIS